MSIKTTKTASQRPRIVVLISGSGSNLQALIDATHSNGSNDAIDANIVAVISNKAKAYGLQRAANAGIPTHVIKHRAFADRESFDQALQEQIDAYQPDLVVLAGFMRILTEGFTRHYLGRMLNIHPSLLPLYKGINTHQRVLDDGCAEHGVSVHFVTPELDGGPAIMQVKIAVQADDTADTLATRIHTKEHVLYPRVVRQFAAGKLHLDNNVVYWDQKALDEPLLLED